ncbi:MAG: tRNA-intron lyase [Halobacteriales archaeon]
MEAHRRGDEIVGGGHARQRFHDARGYGRPLEGNEIALAPIEAAHLLYRGDLDAVDGMGFPAFFESIEAEGTGARFLAYADLRSRGFYLAPEREGWVAEPRPDADFVVYERGADPTGGPVAHRVRAIGERAEVPVASLGDVTLAIADEEGSVTYFETAERGIEGATECDPPAVEGHLLSDRVLIPDPPGELYERGFYGQPVGGHQEGDAIQLSLVEAAFLNREGSLSLDGESPGEETTSGAVEARGRSAEGEHFDRRLTVYVALRREGVVPKTGFKFGADFRTYREVTTVDDLAHSEALVWVLPAGYAFEPRELALYVRLAGGVRKRAVFATVDSGSEVSWLSVDWVTP